MHITEMQETSQEDTRMNMTEITFEEYASQIQGWYKDSRKWKKILALTFDDKNWTLDEAMEKILRDKK